MNKANSAHNRVQHLQFRLMGVIFTHAGKKDEVLIF